MLRVPSLAAALAAAALASVAGAAPLPHRQDGPDAGEQETRIARSALPPAVERTVAVESKNAKVRGFTREIENGQTFYEAELVVNGHSRDVLIDEQGAVVEVEEQIAFASLPAAVRSALTSRAKGGTIRVVESLTKKGTLVAYEAHVVTKGVRSEIQVGPAGETLDHEE